MTRTTGLLAILALLTITTTTTARAGEGRFAGTVRSLGAEGLVLHTQDGETLSLGFAGVPAEDVRALARAGHGSLRVALHGRRLVDRVLVDHVEVPRKVALRTYTFMGAEGDVRLAVGNDGPGAVVFGEEAHVLRSGVEYALRGYVYFGAGSQPCALDVVDARELNDGRLAATPAAVRGRLARTGQSGLAVELSDGRAARLAGADVRRLWPWLGREVALEGFLAEREDGPRLHVTAQVSPRRAPLEGTFERDPDGWRFRAGAGAVPVLTDDDLERLLAALPEGERLQVDAVAATDAAGALQAIAQPRVRAVVVDETQVDSPRPLRPDGVIWVQYGTEAGFVGDSELPGGREYVGVRDLRALRFGPAPTRGLAGMIPGQRQRR